PHYAILMFSAIGFAIALMGLNLLFGFTGLLSFGHAMFLAIGAYTAAYLTSAKIVTRSNPAYRGGSCDCGGGADRVAVHPLRQDLFQHAHAGVQHAALLVSVQILSDYRRRRRAAHQAANTAAVRSIRPRYRDDSDGAHVLLRVRHADRAHVSDVAPHP